MKAAIIGIVLFIIVFLLGMAFLKFKSTDYALSTDDLFQMQMESITKKDEAIDKSETLNDFLDEDDLDNELAELESSLNSLDSTIGNLDDF